MKYFASLPKILGTDNNSNDILLTNLLSRASIIPSLLQNPLLYYAYDLQEGDTPEIVAHKYYDDMYRYWIVLLCNQIMDPQWDWPMSSEVLYNYLAQKYGDFNIHSEIHHYEKIFIQFDTNTGTTTETITTIGYDEYNSIAPSTKTYTLPTGDVVVQTRKQAVTYFDYEEKLNDSKRQIKLLNKSYVIQFEKELEKLMG